MPDFPGVLMNPQQISVSSCGNTCEFADLSSNAGLNFLSASAWPAASRALYIPVRVEMPMTIFKMGVIVGTQSGNLDVGVYDEKGNRLVSAGSTAVAAAGFQSVDITDTAVNPGVYFLAMCVDNTTATFNRVAVAAPIQQTCGVQQQAVGAVTLPSPATFANPAGTYVPAITAFGVVTN